MKPTLSLLTALLLAPLTALHAQTMSELAQAAKRSPGSPKYDDICFSPRWTWSSSVIEAAKVFHATRTEWVYVDDESGPVLQQLRGLGISLGLACAGRDTTEHITGAHGFKAKPQYYTRGRILDIDDKVLDGRPSMHDPATAEILKENLRLCAKFGAERLHQDGPEWNYREWDFNPHALRQFNAWLAARVPAAALEQLGVGNPAQFDLKAYIRSHKDGRIVPPEFEKLWEDFRLEALLRFRENQIRWTHEIVGPGVEWSANYSSLIQFTPERLWSDYAVTELQPSGTGKNGGQFSIGDPWSLYRKAKISRELGKALVVTLGSHDLMENKTMIGLTYAMGLHMLCPYDVYIPGKRRKVDDYMNYADVYDFVHRWGKTYLAGYEEAFALGNGIEHPLSSHQWPPLRIEDPADSVYAFVRARPAQPDAPVVIHLVNWNKAAQAKLALTLEPDRFFPGRGLKLTLLRPSQEPQVLSDGWQARVEVPSPEPWAMLIVEPATTNTAKVWAPEVDVAEGFRFFEKDNAVLRSRTPGAAIHFTTDGSEPTRRSPRYERPIEISRDAMLQARAFSGDQASTVSVFVFSKQPANNLVVASSMPGLACTIRRGVKTSKEPDLDDPMAWAGGDYRFEIIKHYMADRIVLPDDVPLEMWTAAFDGLIEIPRDGLYTFYVNADDECRLELDGRTVVNLTGRKYPPDLGMTELQGRRLLSKGLHKLRIQYLQMRETYGLEVQWQGPGINRQPIASRCLKHSPAEPEKEQP